MAIVWLPAILSKILVRQSTNGRPVRTLVGRNFADLAERWGIPQGYVARVTKMRSTRVESGLLLSPAWMVRDPIATHRSRSGVGILTAAEQTHT